VGCCRNSAARDPQVVVCMCVSGDGRLYKIEDKSKKHEKIKIKTETKSE